MSTKIPNWGQKVIAQAAGIWSNNLVVRMDNDHLICFLELSTREDILVDKETGKVKRG